MKVLITGGAGFIGAHLGRALQERGDEVIVLDNFNEYYDPRLKRARVERLLRPQTTVLEADIVDAARMQQVIRDVQPDAVIHLAAWAGVRPSRKYPDVFASVNVLGSVNVLEASREAGVHRVLFASSSSVYGANAPVPSPEEAAGDEQRSSYGASKRAGELYAALYHRLDGLHLTCLRFFTVYGPWGRPDMAYWKFAKAIERGEPLNVHFRSADGRAVRRGFTDITDIVRGTLAALDRDLPFAIVNLGSDDAVPLRRFVVALEAALGKRARIEERTLPPEEEIQTAADVRRARELIGYVPTVRIEEGLARFVRWYREDFHRAFPHELHPSHYWQ